VVSVPSGVSAAAYRIALRLRATDPPAQLAVDDSPCPARGTTLRYPQNESARRLPSAC